MGKLNWYRVTFKTRPEQPIEWETYLALPGPEWAKYAVETLWEDNGGKEPLLHMRARRVKEPGENILPCEFYSDKTGGRDPCRQI